MTDRRQKETSDPKPGTRFAWLTKYEQGSGEEINESAGSMKNFPKAFIPMQELEDSFSGE